MTQVTERDFMEELLLMANAEYNLVETIQLNLDLECLIDYLIDNSWIIAFYPNDCSKIYAILILEWTGERSASVHFCMFNRGNIYKGWKMFTEIYDQYFDFLETYIPHERLVVLKIATAIGFEFKKIERYHYGRRRIST